MVISPPHKWQKRFNESDIEVVHRIDDPVNQKITDELCEKFTDFRRAYEADGMTVEEFDDFGPNQRTMRQFIAGYGDLTSSMRDFMIPDPDVK